MPATSGIYLFIYWFVAGPGQKRFFLYRKNTANETSERVIVIITPNAIGSFCMGKPTFIPKKLDTMVGIARTIVMDVRSFMTMFRLFDTTDAKASIKPLRMLLYI
jgi:hypothetical protein